MHQLRPGPAVAEARPLTLDILASPADGATRRVGPFEMKPDVALKCAQAGPCEFAARSRCLSCLWRSLWLHAHALFWRCGPARPAQHSPPGSSPAPRAPNSSRKRACAPAARAMR